MPIVAAQGDGGEEGGSRRPCGLSALTVPTLATFGSTGATRSEPTFADGLPWAVLECEEL